MTPFKQLNTSRRLFLATLLGLLCLFAWMRFTHVSDRPMHHDEGVNGWFLTNLVKDNNYKYDPGNYHGPSLYYIQLIPTWVTGLIKTGFTHFNSHGLEGITDTSVRVSVAAAGVLVLVGLLLASNRIGPVGSLAALILAGLSCNLLFFSRYFIHEIFVVLFTLGIYLGLTHYTDKRRPVYLISGLISAVLLFCTKETSLIIFTVMLLAVLCAESTHELILTGRLPSPVRIVSEKMATVNEKTWRAFFYGACIGILIWLILFSSFFKNLQGLQDSFKTFFIWSKTGIESGHNKPFPYFINLLLIKYELAAVLFSLVGAAIASIKNDRRGLFLAYWTFGIILAHSLIPYKTPWVVINLLLPMYLLSGYGIQSLVTLIQTEAAVTNKKTALFTLAVFFALPILLQLPVTLKMVYTDYDNNSYEQVYQHTVRDIYRLINDIDKVAQESPEKQDIQISIVFSSNWPLPYYLRNYPRAEFWERYDNIPHVDAPLIIAQPNQSEELEKLLKNTYSTKDYSLRPGIALRLYINNRYVKRQAPDARQAIPLTRSLTPSKQLRPGLWQDLFAGSQFTGTPATTHVDKINFSYDREAPNKPGTSPFSLRWRGLLKVPSNGIYTFILGSDDGAWLLIDDTLVIDNGEIHPLLYKSAPATLSAGFHKFELKYFDAGGEAVLKLTWETPNQKEEAPLISALFSEEK